MALPAILLVENIQAGISPDHLWRLPEHLEECAAHPIAVRKAGLPRNEVDRVSILLHINRAVSMRRHSTLVDDRGSVRP